MHTIAKWLALVALGICAPAFVVARVLYAIGTPPEVAGFTMSILGIVNALILLHFIAPKETR